MQIISADERLRERRGAKVLVVGPVGVGKTSLLRTVNVERTLFVDIEAGDLAVIDVPVPTIRVDDWVTARDLACRIGGPNKSFAPTMPYSEAHYHAIGGPLEELDRYDLIFVDSISALSRLSFRWAEQQPESFSERTGKRDVRSAYGLLGREMLLWLNQLQHAREKSVVFVGVLERVLDEFNRGEWQLQCEGSKVSRELPVVDEILTMNFLDFGDGEPPSRGFVCSSPNPWNYLGKDRSGRLSQIEPPDLGRLLQKLTTTNHKPREPDDNERD
jgi:AAA domain